MPGPFTGGSSREGVPGLVLALMAVAAVIYLALERVM
jgi:hypothetical protein